MGGELELPLGLVALRAGTQETSLCAVERGLRGDLALQEFILSSKIRFSIRQLRLSLLDAGGCLLDLSLQRAWVDLRKHIT